jgi:hypothetical protein
VHCPGIAGIRATCSAQPLLWCSCIVKLVHKLPAECVDVLLLLLLAGLNSATVAVTAGP